MPRRLGTTLGLCASAGALSRPACWPSPCPARTPRHGVVARSPPPPRLTGAASASTVAFVNAEEGEDQDPDQARGRDLRRERLLRPLLRHLPEGDQQRRRHQVQREEGHAARTTTWSRRKLLKKNPNLYKPFRLAADAGRDLRPEPQLHGRAEGRTTTARWTSSSRTSASTPAGGLFGAPGLTMDYYDGNTVTGLWNYAQNFAMSRQLLRQRLRAVDARARSTWSPARPTASSRSTPTTGAPIPTRPTVLVAPGRRHGVGTIIGDPRPGLRRLLGQQPHRDQPPGRRRPASNIGDLLNAKGVTWGWFQGGFAPTTPCAGAGSYAGLRRHAPEHRRRARRSTTSRTTTRSPYYASTANPHHLPPTLDQGRSGKTDQANHNYDLIGLRPRRSRPATCPRSASSRPAPTRTATPATPTRSTSSTSSSTQINRSRSRRTGRTPRSSSPTTTPTAGTTTGVAQITQRLERRRRSTPRSARGVAPAGAAATRPLRPRPAAAAAGDLAVRARRTTSTTTRPSRRRSCGSSRTTGRSAGSATSRSTPGRARSSTCSTSSSGAPSSCC